MKTKRPTQLIVAIAFVFSIAFANVSTADAQNDRLHARIILVVPENSNPPRGYQKRLGSIGKRTESFFEKWLKHWNRDVERNAFFERDDQGSIEVTLVKAKLKTTQGNDALMELRRQAIQGAKSKLGINQNTKVLWWIFYHYPGVSGFKGGGNCFFGSAINAYPPGTGAINQKLNLASKKLAAEKIKGMMHEFGHAMGLPHNGPRPGLDLGNSLMGPVNRAFRNKADSSDTRVYLNESSAALIWKHPVFQTNAPPKPRMPGTFDVSNIQTVENEDGTIRVSGTLTTNRKPHTAVLLDSRDDKFGDYWARSYTGQMKDETFEITIAEPFEQGTFFVSFCFDNGINTANGKNQQLKNTVVEISYRGKKGKRKFKVNAKGQSRPLKTPSRNQTGR